MEALSAFQANVRKGAAIVAALLDGADDLLGSGIEHPAEIVTGPDVAGAGAVLSPSQVRTFMDCPQRWAYKYIDRVPEVTTAALALGRAVHEAVGENMQQKVYSHADLSAAAVVERFEHAFDDALDLATLREKDSPAALRATGAGLVELYMAEVAPGVDPVAVEIEVSGEVGGVAVHGWLDVLESDGTIRDLKTSTKSPAGIDQMHRFQVSTYAQLTEGASGQVRLDTLVKNKTPKVVSQPWRVTGGDLVAVETLYPRAQAAMRTGVYMPNRCSNLCSREQCSYWRRCEDTFGGRVRGGEGEE